jgi:hypothetical protein
MPSLCSIDAHSTSLRAAGGPSSSRRRRRVPPPRLPPSYAAKEFGIKTGTLVREARRLCPAVIPVQANHRLYTEYHERILRAVDGCGAYLR